MYNSFFNVFMASVRIIIWMLEFSVNIIIFDFNFLFFNSVQWWLYLKKKVFQSSDWPGQLKENGACSIEYEQL